MAIKRHELDVLFQRGSRSGLLTLLRNGTIDPNQLGEHLPLYEAILGRRQDLASLLDHGADVDVREANGDTVLQVVVTVYWTCRPYVQFLIENGADPSCVKGGEGFLLNEVKLCKLAAAHAQGRKLDRNA